MDLHKRIAILFIFCMIFLMGFVHAFPTGDLVHYYGFEESSGNAIDIIDGSNNGTLLGSIIRGGAGKIRNSYWYYQSATATTVNITAYQTTSPTYSNYTNWTLNFWYYLNSTTTDQGFVVNNLGGVNSGDMELYTGGGSKITYVLVPGNAEIVNSTGFNAVAGKWVMLTLTGNSTNYALYVNGTKYLVNHITNGQFMNRNLYLGSNLYLDTFLKGSIDELGFWQRVLTDTEISQLWNSGSGLPLTAMTTQLVSPVNNSGTIDSFAVFNASFNTTIVEPRNATIYLWLNNGSLFNQSTNNISGTGFNSTTWNMSILPLGKFKWNVYVCSNYSTDIYCSWADSNFTFFAPNITESFSPTLIEGETTDMLLNLTFVGINTNILSYLNWNNTLYQPNKYVYGTDTVGFTVLLTVPVGTGNTTGRSIPHYWRFYTPDGSLNETTNSQNQIVYSLGIDNCTIFTTQLLNFNLYDEETRSLIDGYNLNGTIEVEATIYDTTRSSKLATYSKTFSRTNNASICINGSILGTNNVSMDVVTNYLAIGYVNEFYFIDNRSISTSTIPKNISLYDLLATDSTSFLFNFLDNDGLVVDDIIIHVYRKHIGDGVFYEVESVKQNENGDTVIHLVEEDVLYYFVITKYDKTLYTSETYTALCQAIPCLIQLQEGTSSQQFPTDYDLVEDGYYTVGINSITRVVNLSFATTGLHEWNLTVYKLENDGDYTAIASNSLIASVGTISLTVPVSYGNVSFFGAIYKGSSPVQFMKSFWIDFNQKADQYFGTGLSIFLAVLIVMSLGLMAISEGSGIILFLFIGILITLIFGLVDYRLSNGINILIYFFIAGGILVWKVTRRNR